MSDLDDMLDLWHKQSALNYAVSAELEQLHAELAELRDGLVALSNRIEAVTRSRSLDLGLHSVKSPAMYLRAGTTCPRCDVTVHTPAHSCSVSRSNYVVGP